MRLTQWTLSGLLVFGLLAGCAEDSGDPNVGDDDDDNDTGPSACELRVPSELAGDRLGAISGRYIAPFTLQQCGEPEGTTYDFYGDAFCDAKVTVVSMVAGWCGPCRAETTALVNGLAAEYQAKGVRFVQVLIDDNDYGAADLQFCDSEWLGTYDPPFAVLVDSPLVDVQSNVFNGVALPYSAVLNDEGQILAIELGFSEANFRATLDEALELADE